MNTENQRKRNPRAELFEDRFKQIEDKNIAIDWIDGEDSVSITVSRKPHAWLATIVCPDDPSGKVICSYIKSAGAVVEAVEEVKKQLLSAQ